MDMKYLVLCVSHSLAALVAQVALYIYSIFSIDTIIIAIGSVLLSSVAWLTFLKMTEFNDAVVKKFNISCSIAAVISLVFTAAINIVLLEDTSYGVSQLVSIYALLTSFAVYIVVCSLFVILYDIVTDKSLSKIDESISLFTTTGFLAIILSMLFSACYLLALLFTSSLVPGLTYESQRLSIGITVVVGMVRATMTLALAALVIVLTTKAIPRCTQAHKSRRDDGWI